MRNIRRALIVSIFILLANCVFSQAKNVSLTITPAFISFRTITLQPGIEYYLNNKWSLSGEVCYAKPPERKTDFQQVSLFRGALELKRFLKARSNPGYISFQSSYFSRKMSSSAGGYFFEQGGDSIGKYSSAVVHSPILALAVKTGVEANVGKRFFFDLFIGLGVRTSFTRYTAKNIQKQIRQYPKDKIFPLPDPSYLYNCNLTRFHMPVGFRFGMHL